MSDDHSVNIKAKTYHHGDLRASLMRAGLDLLATRTADDLSLRQVARTVGVSANAVYRHFPDKAALMRALAAEGLQSLAASQRQASETAGGSSVGFQATGKAYVRFALANPALFRLIFSQPASLNLLTRPDSDVPDAMAFLRANAAALAAPGTAGTTVALHAWSLAHGLAMLMLDNQVPADDDLIETMFPATIPLSDAPVVPATAGA